MSPLSPRGTQQRTGGDGSAPSPWSSPATVLAGVFLMLLVAAGVVVAIVGPGGGKSKPAPQQQVVVTPKSISHTNAGNGKSGCSLPAGSQTSPAAAPPSGTTWATVGAMSVPQAPRTLGPQRTAGSWNTCFAHSPSGALLAALNFYAEGTAEPSGKVYAKLAVDVPPAALKTRSDTATGLPELQIAGYKYDSYSPGRAQVTVVLQGSQGALEAVVTPMQWTGSDWRYKFPANGVPNNELLQTSTLEPPYVGWSEF